jgi:hypothetical protein
MEKQDAMATKAAMAEVKGAKMMTLNELSGAFYDALDMNTSADAALVSIYAEEFIERGEKIPAPVYKDPAKTIRGLGLMLVKAAEVKRAEIMQDAMAMVERAGKLPDLDKEFGQRRDAVSTIYALAAVVLAASGEIMDYDQMRSAFMRFEATLREQTRRGAEVA